MHKKSDEVVARLSRIEGHVRGLARMVTDNRDCDEVIHQIGAVKAALNQVALIVLEDHLENCLSDHSPQPTEVQKLKDAIGKLV
ncbi:MAG: metal-sensitive transcriptional regulator [Bacillota bacterium]